MPTSLVALLFLFGSMPSPQVASVINTSFNELPAQIQVEYQTGCSVVYNSTTAMKTEYEVESNLPLGHLDRYCSYYIGEVVARD